MLVQQFVSRFGVPMSLHSGQGRNFWICCVYSTWNWRRLQIQSDRMKERYDLLLSGQVLGPGDAVWFYNPKRKKGLSPKLFRPWEGPYVITKRINNLVYCVQFGPRTKPKVVHRNRLWTYSGNEVPTWFQDKEGPGCWTICPRCAELRGRQCCEF